MARSPVTTEDGRRIGASVDAVVFDVFGAVVERRPSIEGQFERVAAPVGEVLRRSLDEPDRMMPDEVLAEHGLTECTDTDQTELAAPGTA
ncbi:hypothetical protein [Streptomyces sp. NBC_01314]|uniref:hypothetical protein n=1 Tax=Streptomyces sp. NBC_01314 TaxID=2903821 RepID=UPI0030924AB2|nr:hypothetical protein OG622_43330 [Streptomyces sp. NBC_01314]